MSDAFDPESYLASKGSAQVAAATPQAGVDQTQLSQFDPDDYLSGKFNESFAKLQARYGTVPQQALAGAEAFGSGLTFGGTRVLENKLGLTTPEDQAARAQANPVTSGLGNFGGGAALLGATGGLGAPLEAAGLGAGALGNVGAKALQFGLEGGAFGAGQAVNDSALGDPNLNAQKVLADVAGGAVFGGLLGASVGGLEGSNISSKLMGFIKKSNGSAETADAIEGGSKWFPDILNPQKANAKEIEEAGKVLKAPTPGSFTSASKWYQQANSALVDGAPTIAGILKRNTLDEGFAKVSESLGDVLDTGNEFGGGPMTKRQLGEALQKSLTDKIAADVEPLNKIYSALEERNINVRVPEGAGIEAANEIMSIPESKHGFADAALANKVAKYLPEIETAADLESYKTSLNKSLGLAASPGEKHMMGEISDIMQDLYEKSVKKAAEGVPDLESLIEEHNNAKKMYAPFKQDLNTLAEQLGKRSGRGVGAQTITDFINKLDPETLAEKLFDKKYSKFNDFLERYSPSDNALLKGFQKQTLKDAASKSGEFSPKVFLNKIRSLQPEIKAQIFSPEELKTLGAADTYLTNFPKNYNPSNTSNQSAFRSFFEHPVGAAAANLRDFGIAGFMKLMDSLPEKPNPFVFGQQMAEKYNILSAVKASVQNIDSQIEGGIKSILRRGAEGAALSAGARISDAGFDKLKKHIDEYSKNPEKALNDLEASNHLVDHTPNILASMHQTSGRGLTFLQSKLPQAPANWGLNRKWQASEYQKAKFMQYAEAVQNPISVLSQVKKGTLSTEAMEALQVVHPDLLNHMRNQLKQAIASKKPDSIPYKTKVSMSRFLGEPLGPSMTPQVIMSNQQSLSGPSLSNNNAKPATQRRGRGHAGALSKLNLASRSKTQLNKDDPLEDI